MDETINKVYGIYSTGSGTGIEEDSVNNIFSDSSIAYYEKEISENLYKMGLDIDSLSKFNVFNIGTGRETIALYNLGAKMVSHYDFSKENVKRLQSYIENFNIKKIKTRQANIVDYQLKHAQFDLAYVHGIVQHFSNTGMGLLNVLKAIKKGGLIWLYFYRSGSFGQFIISMMRDVGLKKENMSLYYTAVSLLATDKVIPNQYVSGFMDSVFCEHANLFVAEKYIDFLNKCGFKIVSSSKLDPFNKTVDHKYSHQSSILVGQLEKPDDLYKITSSENLSPTLSVNQLDKCLYEGKPYGTEIIDIIEEYEKLKIILTKINSDMIKFSFVYKVFDIHVKSYEEYCKNGYYNLDEIYPLLKNTIINLRQLAIRSGS